VAGFAGSVLIGFKLLESLREYLVLPPEAIGQNNAWKPQWVGDNWGAMAKGLFDASPVREKRLGSQILLVGVSPDEDIGAPEFRRVYIIRLSNPGFQSGFMRKAFTVCHIGSGGGVDRYKRAIRQHFRLDASSLRAELGGPGGWAQMLGHTVDLIAGEHPVDGVSPHVHIVVCRLGGFLEGNNDRRSYPSDGSSPIEFRMPRCRDKLWRVSPQMPGYWHRSGRRDLLSLLLGQMTVWSCAHAVEDTSLAGRSEHRRVRS
jgi:hypothetical protein